MLRPFLPNSLKVLFSDKFKNRPFQFISQILLSVFIFSFPFQIQTIVYSNPIYTSGNFNPFTTFFISINDFILLGAFISWSISLVCRENPVKKFESGPTSISLLLAGLISILLANTFLVENGVLNLLNVFRLIELALFYLLIVNSVLSPKLILYIFIASMCFQSAIAIFQYSTQQSIGLHFLGEPIATNQTPGIAKFEFMGQKVIRAFGTFPHANILGGNLNIAIISIFFVIRKNWWIRTPLLILLFTALLFTFSRSAYFSLIVSMLLVLAVSKRKINFRPILLAISTGLFLIVLLNLQNILWQRLIFDDQAIEERSFYFGISKAIFLKNPFGIGLGGFTEKMQDFTTTKILPWIYQPIHNIYLLLLNEGGIFALILFTGILISLFSKLIKKNSASNSEHVKTETAMLMAMLTNICTIGLFDHYAFTIYSGQILLFMTIGLCSFSSIDIFKTTKSDILSENQRLS